MIELGIWSGQGLRGYGQVIELGIWSGQGLRGYGQGRDLGDMVRAGT